MQLFRKTSLSRPEGEAGKTWPAIAMGFFVAFGGVLFGYGILFMPYWQKLFSTGYMDSDGNPNITTSQESTLLGVILQTIATAIPMFIAGRFFASIGVCMISAMIPLYQSETAPKWIRGVIIGAYQWAITIGLLLAAVINNTTSMRNNTGSYRIPVAVQFAWSLFLCFGMLVLPKPPRFLIMKDQLEKAACSLGESAAELAEIQASYNYEKSLGEASWLDCFRPPLLKRQCTGMAIQALQQLSSELHFYYCTKYFQNSGISSGFVISMITSAINVASTIPGMYTIDRWGRRPLLLWNTRL
ncbi:hypothetical protein DER44DRAFT_807408 [Fusarium oxysporum]|nr:hypothetical protein DER44DRAFT_807408 [Fusarium oxysporum]